MRVITLILLSLAQVLITNLFAQSITQSIFTSTGSSSNSSGVSLNFTVGELSINHLKSPSVNVTTGLFGKVEEEQRTLPVSLLDFNLNIQGSTVQLNWTVSQEITVSAYEIQKSADGIHFTVLGTTAAVGNSTTVLRYHFTDRQFVSRSFYRLKMIDVDGRYTFSPILLASPYEASAKAMFFPNPSRNTVNLTLSTNSSDIATVFIRNAAGITVMRKSYALTAGQNAVSILVDPLPSGTYYVSVTAKDINVTKPLLKL
jgi:hypothetical protein